MFAPLRGMTNWASPTPVLFVDSPRAASAARFL